MVPRAFTLAPGDRRFWNGTWVAQGCAVTSSTENPIPTQTFLLPGQGFCIGLPWERAELPKHGLPALAPKPIVVGNVLDQKAELEGDPCAGWEIGRCEVIRRLTPGSARRLLALRHDLVEGNDVVDLRQLDVDDGEGPTIEAYAADAMRLRHPNLAHVHDCEVSDEGIFWVSERVSGATLAEIAAACRVQGKAVPIGLALPAVHEAALALHEVHQRTTHGLMSNQAIAVNFAGVTKLLDVGLFQVLARKRSWAEVLEITGPYLAPEQVFAGRLPDPKADLYSLGIVLYECLTGESVRRTAKFEDRVKMMERGDLPPPSSRNVMLGKGVDEVMMRVLSSDRAKRYGSALEFANELKRVSSSFMWRNELRATFVGELFETRRRREQALTAHLAPRRRRTATAEQVVVSAPLKPIAKLEPLDPMPVRAMPIAVQAPAASPPRKKSKVKKSALELADLSGSAAGLAVGFVVAMVSWGQLVIDASGKVMPLSRAEPVHEVVGQPLPLELAMTFEVARAPEAIASIGELVQVAPIVVKKAAPKIVRRSKNEAPIPPWLRRRGR